jgi:chemotaxis protein histidine kinase CheA
LAVPPLATSPTDANAAIRRDYELAERIATKPVWDSFINNYPSGFYADLAKAQRDKLSAEAASTAATEKAKAAVAEQKSLAIEGAKSAEQAKAAAQAKAAEDARVTAERKKAIEEAKVAEAERAKAAAQAEAAEAVRIAAERQKALEDAKAAETERAKVTILAKSADERNAQDDKSIGELVVLTPPDQAGDANPKPDRPTVADISRLLQIELRRVGCNTGAIDGNWNAAAQKSFGLFNKNAGMKLDVKVASLDALDAVRSKPARICPLICEHGYEADGDNCNKITCKAGLEVGDDNSCEKVEPKKPAGKRDAPSPANPQRPATSSAPARDSLPRLENESPRAQGDGSCSLMKDPLGCNCALKTGGYIYASPGSPSGYRFRSTNMNAYSMCLYAAGRR